MDDRLLVLREELDSELREILDFWSRETLDLQYGGFIGRIDHQQIKRTTADKGAVLHARILWTFSAAYRMYGREQDGAMGTRVYEYIKNHFVDTEHGGIYWTVDYLGCPVDTKKQIYALAFTIYALAEYSRSHRNEEALQLAIDIYQQIEQHAFDRVHNGYFEAFDRQWQLQEDFRLSDKDANEAKTMNTHLHVLEAYSTLYAVWPDEGLLRRIQNLLSLFENKILRTGKMSLNLFFDQYWQVKGDVTSYGHDIEASWLLLEAAEKISDEHAIHKFSGIALYMADACIQGLMPDGSLSYERDNESGHVVSERHWWVQAESMVGFFQAYQLSGQERYLDIVFRNWTFIQQQIKDKVHGEWHWGIDEKGRTMPEDKVGPWKCPYHNARACMEIIQRISG